MADGFSDYEFLNKLGGLDKWPQTMAELVDGWIAHWTIRFSSGEDDDTFFWAYQCASELCMDSADLGFEFVLAVLKKGISADQIPVLAAGPLEEVLSYHGAAVIDRVEEEARRSSDFCHLLGGVWKNQMPDEIWQRVLKVAPNRW
jgi:hypothetical protein